MNDTQTTRSYEELQETWPPLSPDERLEGFRPLAAADAGDFFLRLITRDQATLQHYGGGRRWYNQRFTPSTVSRYVSTMLTKMKKKSGGGGTNPNR